MLEILKEVKDPRLRMDFVWTRIWSTDSLQTATNALAQSADPRARVWWDMANILSKGLFPFFGVDPVWDVYMIYKPGVLWGVAGTDTPGPPEYYQHQMGALPYPLFLDKKSFKAAILERLPPCTSLTTE